LMFIYYRYDYCCESNYAVDISDQSQKLFSIVLHYIFPIAETVSNKS